MDNHIYLVSSLKHTFDSLVKGGPVRHCRGGYPNPYGFPQITSTLPVSACLSASLYLYLVTPQGEFS